MQTNGPMLKPATMLGSQTSPGQQPTLLQPQRFMAGQTRPIQLATPGSFPQFGIQPVELRAPAIRPMVGVRPLQSAQSTTQNPQASIVGRTTAHDPQMSQLKALRTSSGLKHIPVASSLLAFKNSAENARLSRAQFFQSYREQLTRYGVPIPDQLTQDKVFALFDKDKNNVVDMMELVCGISLLCKGTEDEKIRAVFNMFDANADGMISMEEMFKFLSSVYKVVLTPSVAQTMKQMGIETESAEDLASVTALECFKTADLNGDGLLSLEEFNKWFYKQ